MISNNFLTFLKSSHITAFEPSDFHLTVFHYSRCTCAGNDLHWCFVDPWDFPHSAHTERKPLQIFKLISWTISHYTWANLLKPHRKRHTSKTPYDVLICQAARPYCPSYPPLLTSAYSRTHRCIRALLYSRTRWLSDSGAVLSLCEIALEWVWW